MIRYIEKIKKYDIFVTACLAIIYLYAAVSPVRPFGVWPGFLLGGSLVVAFCFLRRKIIDKLTFPAILNIKLILLVGFVIRLLWVIFTDNTWVSDFARYDNISRQMLVGNFLSDREMPLGTSLITAFFYWVFGVNRYAALLPVLVASVAMIYFVYLVTQKIFGEVTAKVSAMLCCLCPEQIIYTNLVNSDIYFAFFLLVAFWSLLALPTRHIVINILLAGVFFGMSQYVRSNSTLFVFCAVLFIMLYSNKKSLVRTLRLNLVLIVTYLAVLTPLILFNYSNFKALTINSSRGLGWFLFLSTNPVHNGKYNYEDFKLWKERVEANTRHHPEDYTVFKYRVAKEMAKERFLASPTRFIMNLHKKPYMLLNDPASFKWSLNGINSAWVVTLIFGIGLVYHRTLLVLGGITCLLIMRSQVDEKIRGFLFVTGCTILLVVISHFFLEIQTRYHYMLMPYVIIVAASYFRKINEAGIVQPITNP